MEEKLYTVNYNDITDIIDETDNHIILSKRDILRAVSNFVRSDWPVLPVESHTLYELNKKTKYIKFSFLEKRSDDLHFCDYSMWANSKLVIKSYPSYTDENNTVITPIVDYSHCYTDLLKIGFNVLKFSYLESGKTIPYITSFYKIIENPDYFKHFKKLFDEWIQIRTAFTEVENNISITENYENLKFLESENPSITFKYVPDYNNGDLVSVRENHCEIESIGD